MEGDAQGGGPGGWGVRGLVGGWVEGGERGGGRGGDAREGWKGWGYEGRGGVDVMSSMR